MFESQALLSYNVEKYFNERTIPRKVQLSQIVRDVGSIIKRILNEVEQQEPRFISSLSEIDGRLEGLEVISPDEYEVVLYLNQMGVFSLVEDGVVQSGCAMLKLSDGRKRSMSLWVEFITASGYLSARKVRSRFQTLVSQGIEKSNTGQFAKIVPNTSDVRLIIRNNILVKLTPAFKCTRLWPQSASNWPDPTTAWPYPTIASDIKQDGFSLLSKEACYQQNKHSSSTESDAWVMSFTNSEDKLLNINDNNGMRRKCLSILKTIRDRHLDYTGSPLNNYHMKVLLLYECEKHPRDQEWDSKTLGDRIKGILLQLVSCLRCRRLPHFFLPSVDLFTPNQSNSLDVCAREVWRVTREIITCDKSFENL